MNHSQACVDFVAAHEGCKLESYQDSIGIWTIGYGHTYNVGPGDSCTAEKAKSYLNSDLTVADRGVNQAVTVELTQNEFDALVSLAFNIGVAAFQHSTLVKKLNAGDKAGAADQFLLWAYAGHRRIEGLANRRADERKLFLTPESA